MAGIALAGAAVKRWSAGPGRVGQALYQQMRGPDTLCLLPSVCMSFRIRRVFPPAASENRVTGSLPGKVASCPA